MGPGPVKTRLGPESVNRDWGPGPLNTNWRPGPVNTNWGPWPGSGTAGQDQGRGSSRGSGAGKYKYRSENAARLQIRSDVTDHESEIKDYSCSENLGYSSQKHSDGVSFWAGNNPLTTTVTHHRETSQLIWNANQLTGFYMIQNIDR